MGHFQDVKDFKSRIVVPTYVLSRGVDVSRINVAINYDFPYDADTYFHCMGHADRFGSKEFAISLFSAFSAMTIGLCSRTSGLIRGQGFPTSWMDYMNVV